MRKIIFIVYLCFIIFFTHMADAIINIQDPSLNIAGVNIEKTSRIINNFLDLIDTPSSYAGQGGNCVVVGAGENALEFGVCGGGGSAGDKWIDGGAYIYPNSTFADNIKIFGYIHAIDWSNLTDLTDTLYAEIKWGYNMSDGNDGGMDYTNIGMTNITNVWEEIQNFSNNIISSKVISQDSYTYMEIDIENISFYSGGTPMLQLQKTWEEPLWAVDKVYVNWLGEDVDFAVGNNTASLDNRLFYVDSSELFVSVIGGSFNATDGKICDSVGCIGDFGIIYTHLSNFTDDILWTSNFNSTGDSKWGDNSSWNESLANTLYAEIKWGYNMSDGTGGITYTHLSNFTDDINATSTYNETYDTWSYNQSLGTYNQYGHWWYNMSDGAGEGNLSWNQSHANLLYAQIQWGYNQSIGIFNEYGQWWYNMTTGNCSATGSCQNIAYMNHANTGNFNISGNAFIESVIISNITSKNNYGTSLKLLGKNIIGAINGTDIFNISSNAYPAFVFPSTNTRFSIGNVLPDNTFEITNNDFAFFLLQNTIVPILKVDGDTGRVGIRTLGPSVELDVNGSVKIKKNLTLDGYPKGEGFNLTMQQVGFDNTAAIYFADAPGVHNITLVSTIGVKYVRYEFCGYIAAATGDADWKIEVVDCDAQKLGLTYCSIQQVGAEQTEHDACCVSAIDTALTDNCIYNVHIDELAGSAMLIHESTELIKYVDGNP